MNIRSGLVFFLALTACSGAGSSGSSQDAAAADSSDGCALLQGMEVCNSVFEGYCQGLNTCCAPNLGACTQCSGPGCNLAQCRTWLVQAGEIDCSAIPYQRNVCATPKCLRDVEALTCNEYLSSTGAPFPASCNPLFAQLSGMLPPP